MPLSPNHLNSLKSVMNVARLKLQQYFVPVGTNRFSKTGILVYRIMKEYVRTT